jgi:hypothetical protein
MTTRTSLVALAALAALTTTALSSNPASAFGAGHFAQGTNKGSGFGGAPNRTGATPSMPTHTAGTASANGQTGFQHKLASNGTQLNTTHALADPCSGVGAPKTCFLNQGKGVGGTGGSAAALGAKTPGGSGTTGDPCSGVGAPKTCFLNQGKGVDGTGGSAAALGAKTTTNIGPVLVPTTAPAIPSGSKGSGSNTNANNTTGNGTTPTGGGTGSGGNANNGNGRAPGQMASNQPCGYGCGNEWNRWHHPYYGSGSHVETAPVYAPPPVYTRASVYQASTYQAPVQTTYAPAPQTYVQPAQTYASAPSAEPCNCLAKSYMQDGSVMFVDNCTKETAMAAPASWQQGQTAPQQSN